ncbi:acyl-CoA N-acyltransferase [Lophiotrema nucula]|uniref:Acyl-CoA N-acyltransferase n=1 Tax=Lophiotrema nucula TaxID=690887 RepID=A0A6A5ZIH7_9PLEO|nr:acyl-CoA N-acyltransferase [Lophiotrema nucula]
MPLSIDPFRSERLIYRAVRAPEDNALFDALTDDRFGYMNSNASNIKLPGAKDARDHQKQVAEKALLGAVICLQPQPTLTTMKQKSEAVGEGEIGAELAQRVEIEKIKDEDGKKTIKQEVKKEERYGSAIGQITLKALPAAMAHHRSTEIAIDILPEYQGKGYGSEAITWVLDYAFRRAGLHRVEVRAFAWNEGAVRLYEKLGFAFEGRKREALWHEGKWWDGVEFGMLESEWWDRQRGKERMKE